MSSRLDDLTQLPLRSAYIEAAVEQVADAQQRGTPLSLLVVDVDHFKLVNDTFGHLQGDDVLCELAEILRSSLRAGDVPARYAGDEFVALLPNTPLERAREVAERVAAAIRGHAFRRRDEKGTVAVTVCIGVASLGIHGQSHEDLFAAADRALYVAKRGGRDGVATAATDAHEPAHLPLGIERFVGRHRELRTLVTLLEEAGAGRPQVVAIAGEAGVGKTTLLRQLEPEVRLRRGSLVVGRCQEADVRPPFAPWADALAAILRLGVVPPRAWRELPRLLPGLATEGTPDSRGGNKYLLLEEIAEFLRLAAADRAIVVVLDDMQWADSASWDALEYLVPQLETERVLLCLTIRAEDAEGEVTERRQRLSRNERFHEMRIARLTRDELRAWLEGAFHRQDVGREFLAFLYRHTEGNALFIVQLLRTLVDEGYVWHNGERWDWKPVSELRLPSAVSDLISRRIARLSERSQEVLVTAAVIGREFDIDLAIAAGAGTEDELLDAVDEGIQNWVLESTAKRGGDLYQFTHGLLAEVLRDSVNPRRLRKVHERVAVAMVERMPDALAEIATHFDRGGNAVEAYRWALRAAERSRLVYGHQEAEEFLRTAERNAADAAELAEVRVRLADIAEVTGKYQEAEELCDLAIEWFTGAGDRRRALALRLQRERVRGLLGQPAFTTLAACRALEEEARTPGFERERAALLLVLSREEGRIGDREAAERDARECVAVATSTGDPALRADALNRHALTLQRDEPEQAEALYASALAIFRELSDYRGQAHCHSNLGVLHTTRGAWEKAAQEFEVALVLGRTAGTPDLRGVFAINLGVVHMRCGRFEQARDLFGEALALFATTRNQERQVYALYNLAHLDRERGAAEAAGELYAITGALAGQLGQADVEIGAHAGLGLALLAREDRPAAAAAHGEALTRMKGRDDWFQGRELVEALGIRLEALGGAGADAATRLEQALVAASAVDAYGAAWLLAECAPVLAVHVPARVRGAIQMFVPRVDALGLELLRRRYDEILATL